MPQKNLYLANNIKSLDLIALKQDEALKSLKRIDLLFKTADKIGLLITEDPDDEEKTYVYLTRYLSVVEKIKKGSKEEDFVKSRFNRNLSYYKDHFSLIKKNLINRYELLCEENVEAANEKTVVEVKPIVADNNVGILELENGPFILCKNMYYIITKTNLNVLIIDIRPKQEYEQSHMKGVDVANIPEKFIVRGLSAHKLEQALMQYDRKLFGQRTAYDVVILLDWKTVPQSFVTSKIQIMHEILTKWEFEVTYKHQPLMLNGGYLEWIEMYPTFSTNPHVMYNKKYADLDELLDLDNIQYPTDITNASIMKIVDQQNAVVQAPTPTRDKLLNKLHEIVLKQLSNEQDLLNCQTRLIEVNKLLESSNQPDSSNNLKEEKVNLEQNISKLESLKIQVDERKTKLNNEFSMVASFEPGTEPTDFIEKRQEIDALEKKIVLTYKQRKDLVQSLIKKSVEPKENITKPSSFVEESKRIPKAPPAILPTTKPVIDRKRKPTTMSYLPGTIQTVDRGLTGLENINNTCFINTLIQCLRHVPEIIHFFCQGIYTSTITGKRTNIIVQFAALVRSLWSNSHTVIRPTEFLTKMRKIEPGYGNGQHECVYLFFLVLLHHLHTDSSYDIPEFERATPIVTAWSVQFKNKLSFFLINFYYQIKETQYCPKCKNKAVRFQIEPALMVSVPENNDFTLEEIIAYYLESDSSMCTTCNVNCSISKTFTHNSPIMTIVLKRYKAGVRDDEYTRNNYLCYFPRDNLQIGRYRYKLRAIAMHQGTLNAGHYTAACLNPQEKSWYEYNDSIVSPMDINDPKVKMKAYVFFYSIMNENKTSKM